jgi:sialate O-acetylesterase
LREAQFQTASSPHTAMIVTHDLVTPSDNVHYLDKLPVGQRMALAALGTVYGKSIEYSGPVYHHVEFKGGKARITFDHVGGGLIARGDKLGGFALAGADRKWVWANAHIHGDSVIVESLAIPNPVAVRYAWTDTPCGANLFNKAGLPASGFRTDKWPLTTAGVQWVQKN